MSRIDSWMPIYWGDYLRDTMHLQPEGHGAYLLLMAAYWTSGEALLDDDESLRAITGLDLSAWGHLKPTLKRFFIAKDGVWRHKRIDEEIKRAKHLTKVRRASGKLGGKSKAKGLAKRWQKASPSQPQPQPPLPSPLPSQIKETPTELYTSELDHAFNAFNALAEKIGRPKVQRRGSARKAALGKRLSECGGLEGWRALLAKVEGSRYLRGEVNGWKCDFDFLVRASKFTRIMEGSFDDQAIGDGHDRNRDGSEGFLRALAEVAEDRSGEG